MSGPTFRMQWSDAIRDSTDPRLDPIALAVAMALDRHMNAAGRTHAGQHRLARTAKLRTTETVVDRIAVLEEAGWLKVTRPTRRGGRTRYQAVIPADHPTVSDGSDHPTVSDGRAVGRNPQPSDATNPQPSDATGKTVRRRRTEPEEPEGSSRGRAREPLAGTDTPAGDPSAPPEDASLYDLARALVKNCPDEVDVVVDDLVAGHGGPAVHRALLDLRRAGRRRAFPSGLRKAIEQRIADAPAPASAPTAATVPAERRPSADSTRTCPGCGVWYRACVCDELETDAERAERDRIMRQITSNGR